MGVDYYACEICGEVYCDCGPCGFCEGCETSMCGECHDEAGAKYRDAGLGINFNGHNFFLGNKMPITWTGARKQLIGDQLWIFNVGWCWWWKVVRR